MHRVEAIAHVDARRHEVGHYDSTTDAADARHLGDRVDGTPEVMERTPARHHVERFVDEGQRGDVAFLEQHVVDARDSQALRTEPQKLGREVDPHHLVHFRRHLLRNVPRAAGHVEHDEVGTELTQPCGRFARKR